MENQFEIFDVYGRRVFCSKRMWNEKLCGKHGFLQEDENLVRRAIGDPEDGYPRYDKDPKEPNRRVYYRKSKAEDFYVKVVVEFHYPEDDLVYGNVITGYVEDTIDMKEKQEKKP